MRRLHRGEDAEFREPRNILRTQNLGVLDSPARIMCALQRIFVKIKNKAVGAIANGVSFDLDFVRRSVR